MKRHIATLTLVLLMTLATNAWAQVFFDDFESYPANSSIHGHGGWKGWNNMSAWDGTVSNEYAYSGSNSVRIRATTDLVHELNISGGRWQVTAMQYIRSATMGASFFILLNTYDDGENAPKDWSVQTECDMSANTILYWHGGTTPIVFNQWVQLKYIIDLDNNTVQKYYNGNFITTDQWDDDQHGTLQAIDLYGNGASSVYYDDIKVENLSGPVTPPPGPGTSCCFPRPNYDSGWQSWGGTTSRQLTHSLGGDVGDYLVDLQFKMNMGVLGIHNFGTGHSFYSNRTIGAYWQQLTPVGIRVIRASQDYVVDQFRVRIWVCQ